MWRFEFVEIFFIEQFRENVFKIFDFLWVIDYKLDEDLSDELEIFHNDMKIGL